MSEENLVVVEEKEGYAVLRINRPDKRNAMNKAARIAMLEAMEDLKGRFGVIVLTGTDVSFCAGLDLKEASADREAGVEADPATSWQAVNVAIRAHPAVFIAAVNGLALGGGVTLINVCDLAVASERASMGMPEMGFATYPGLAGPSTQYSLTRKRHAWMMFTTERIDGATAERWGLVNKVVPHDQLLPEAEAIAAKIGQFNQTALTISKGAMDQIPVEIDWDGAFNFGIGKIDEINRLTAAGSEGLARFSKGERLVGQG
ncbi:enoyl-CoA hydratase/isomerase family protein [Sphingomonas bisphenolicum]|uniref:Crotonase n=1 Tax=Sphingomonas bisphenolicum TaxID=296544 RepID=A0ABM7G446_9SPHN|nr:enoyl-CoA hydratase/isomerase family protein [Sphingomonas bisphenolicum]BBF72002.1 crotonase [Sphingomonas bisphenolicum]